MIGTDITYKTKILQNECTNFKIAKRNYGKTMAEKLHQRVQEIIAADCVETLVTYLIGRCHPLKGNKEGQYAMDLVHPYRLVFEKDGSEISIVKMLCVEDYH